MQHCEPKLNVALCLAKLSQSVAARSSTRVPGPHSFQSCGVSGHAGADPLTGVEKERVTTGRPVHSRSMSGCRVLVLKCAFRCLCGWSLLLHGAWHKAWSQYDATGIQAHDAKRLERFRRHKRTKVFDGDDAAQRGGRSSRDNSMTPRRHSRANPCWCGRWAGFS